nr:tyrosine-type recombinase/integrase [uncultured Romboutsia sp.]
MVRLKSNGIAKANTVDPLKNKKDIQKIKQYLKGKDNKRDYMLFVVGINVGLRVGDLLKLKIKDVIDNNGNFKDKIVITEEKTDKTRNLKLNDSVKESIKLYLDSLKSYDMDDYLFKSRKGNKPLRVDSTHKIIKNTLRELNIKGNYGTHTLRKTWSYHIYMSNSSNPRILAILQKALNHSSQAVTLRYIGIEQEEILDLYDSNF